MKSKQSIAVLASSGPDSMVLLHWAAQRYRKIYPIYIRQGYRWEDVELYWLRKILKEIPKSQKCQLLSILRAPLDDVFKKDWSLNGKKVPGFYSAPPSVYLPGRNLFLLSKAAVYCKENKIKKVAVGTLKGNPFVDGKAAFFKDLERVIRSSLNFPIKVYSPFVKWKKERVLRHGKDLPLHLTFSCLNPKGKKHCGKCNKCAERARAFASCGILRIEDYGVKKFVRTLM